MIIADKSYEPIRSFAEADGLDKVVSISLLSVEAAVQLRPGNSIKARSHSWLIRKIGHLHRFGTHAHMDRTPRADKDFTRRGTRLSLSTQLLHS